MKYSTRLPIRMGTTSYLFGDDLFRNITSVGPLVDDIELVLFSYNGLDNIPKQKDVPFFVDVAQEHEVTYTVHFPLETHLGSSDENKRKDAIDMYARVGEVCDQFNPFSYVLHLTPESYGNVPSQNIDRWLGTVEQSLHEMIALGFDPKRVCIENLSYPFELVYPLVETFDFSLTLDIGHVWLGSYDVDSYLDLFLPRAHIIHLHGVHDRIDHKGLTSEALDDITYFIKRLFSYVEKDSVERVVTLEVFSYEDFIQSLDILEKAIEKTSFKEDFVWER